jgi:hypothetical protein
MTGCWRICAAATAEAYRRLVEQIRTRLDPNDNFRASHRHRCDRRLPGESPAQFQRTYDLLAERLDVAHLRATRPAGIAERRPPDDVPEEEKMTRFRAKTSRKHCWRISSRYLGLTVEVLFEDQVRPLARTHYQQAGLCQIGGCRRPGLAGHDHLDRPWSMQGRLQYEQSALIPPIHCPQ